MADGWSSVSIGFTDEGPGIADVDLALADGWSMGDGLGLGLPGARRLVASAGHALGYQRPAGRRPASWVRRPHVQRTNIPVMAAIRPAVELSWASRRVLACRAVPARQIRPGAQRQNSPFCTGQLTTLDGTAAAPNGGYARALSHVGSHAL